MINMIIYKVHELLADCNLVCEGIHRPCFRAGKTRCNPFNIFEKDMNVFMCDKCYKEFCEIREIMRDELGNIIFGY